jgi:hypothetical protein
MFSAAPNKEDEREDAQLKKKLTCATLDMSGMK